MTNYIDNGIIKVGVKSFGATPYKYRFEKKSGYEFFMARQSDGVERSVPYSVSNNR